MDDEFEDDSQRPDDYITNLLFLTKTAVDDRRVDPLERKIVVKPPDRDLLEKFSLREFYFCIGNGSDKSRYCNEEKVESGLHDSDLAADPCACKTFDSKMSNFGVVSAKISRAVRIS